MATIQCPTCKFKKTATFMRQCTNCGKRICTSCASKSAAKCPDCKPPKNKLEKL